MRKLPVLLIMMYSINGLKDLGLVAGSVPLLAGETVTADQNGACAGMNKIIATLQQIINQVPSAGCEGIADRFHFRSNGLQGTGHALCS